MASDNVSEFFQYHLDRRTRTIYFGPDDLDHASCASMLKALHMLDHSSTSPIKIIINQPGGEDYHMFAIYDAVKSCESEVIGLVRGHAMSAASVILQACDTRMMSPNSWLMIHNGDWESGPDHLNNFFKGADHVKKLLRQMEDIYLDRIHERNPDFTRKALQHRLLFDYYLQPEEAIALGLADGIDE